MFKFRRGNNLINLSYSGRHHQRRNCDAKPCLKGIKKQGAGSGERVVNHTIKSGFGITLDRLKSRLFPSF